MSGIKNPIQKRGFTPLNPIEYKSNGGFTDKNADLIMQLEANPDYCKLCGGLIKEAPERVGKETDWGKVEQERKYQVHFDCLHKRMG